MVYVIINGAIPILVYLYEYIPGKSFVSITILIMNRNVMEFVIYATKQRMAVPAIATYTTQQRIAVWAFVLSRTKQQIAVRVFVLSNRTTKSRSGIC